MPTIKKLKDVQPGELFQINVVDPTLPEEERMEPNNNYLLMCHNKDGRFAVDVTDDANKCVLVNIPEEFDDVDVSVGGAMNATVDSYLSVGGLYG